MHNKNVFSKCACFFFFNPECSLQAEVMDVTGAKSDLCSNGSCFVPAFGGYVNYWVECCGEGDDDELG